MNWKKEISHSSIVNSDYLLAAIMILFVIGLFIKQPVLYIMVGIFIAYFIIYKVYNKLIGNKLNLKDKRIKIRLFKNDESFLTLEFSNQSLFPMINGVLEFQLNDAVSPTQHDSIEYTYWREVKVPLSIIGKGKTTIEIPIRAAKRGTSFIQNINYTFPHLFNFEPFTLTYLKNFQTEIIVFPKLIPVKAIEATFQMVPGTHLNQISPFEDIQSPLGTRDYSYSDPFHRINWKATAKANQLQTNLYEKVVDLSFTFIVNLGNQFDENMVKPSKELEDILSNTAYLCRYATKRGIPFELYINARKPGKIPYVQLQEGEGSQHYGKTLEVLARINHQALLLPFKQMIYQIEKKFYKSKTMILLGDVSPEAERMIDQWSKKQNIVYHVKNPGEDAILKPWKKEVIQRAT